MAYPSLPMNSNPSALFEVPRRVALACANCRERKIKARPRFVASSTSCLTLEPQCITEGKDRTCMRCHFNGMQCEYVATQRQRERVLSRDTSTRTRAGRKTQAQTRRASRSPRLSPYPSPRLQLEVPPPEPEWAMAPSYGDAAAPAFEFAAYECALSPSLSPLPSIARSGCRPSAGTPSLTLASDHDVDVFALAGGAYYGAAADADAYPTPPSSASTYPHPHESQTALYMHAPDALPSPLYGTWNVRLAAGLSLCELEQKRDPESLIDVEMANFKTAPRRGKSCSQTWKLTASTDNVAIGPIMMAHW
ncbi:hypothetical protein GGX14DRAFT_406148 [Mycena pura]|uniref:Zn(2)-C6 fungal-type domain-containing protein n=1 Tax=Mycena pura TaxID=153505 RepID=A0AAD6Y1S7_9AGAR|nr:hypothetical protein GGX14DRAFT_406148 [Mycena pura]